MKSKNKTEILQEQNDFFWKKRKINTILLDQIKVGGQYYIVGFHPSKFKTTGGVMTEHWVNVPVKVTSLEFEVLEAMTIQRNQPAHWNTRVTFHDFTKLVFIPISDGNFYELKHVINQLIDTMQILTTHFDSNEAYSEFSKRNSTREHPFPVPDIIDKFGRLHILKTWPKQYAEVGLEIKKAEIRKHDREYMIGDYVAFAHFVPTGENTEQGRSKGFFQGSFILAKITHILDEFTGIEKGFCMFSFELVNAMEMPEDMVGMIHEYIATKIELLTRESNQK